MKQPFDLDQIRDSIEEHLHKMYRNSLNVKLKVIRKEQKDQAQIKRLLHLAGAYQIEVKVFWDDYRIPISKIKPTKGIKAINFENLTAKDLREKFSLKHLDLSFVKDIKTSILIGFNPYMKDIESKVIEIVLK
jgi:hypothetical protein